MQLDHTGAPLLRHAHRAPSTLPPPPPAPELTTEPATLMERVTAWGQRHTAAAPALLVAVATVGAWFGFKRQLPAPLLVLVQCEPSRWGLDYSGDAVINDPTARAVALSDPPDRLAVAAVDELLRRLDQAPPFALLEVPDAFRAVFRPSFLAEALRAVEPHGDARVTLYPCTTPDGPRLVLLGAAYMIAVTTYQERPDVQLARIELLADTLDALTLGRP